MALNFDAYHLQGVRGATTCKENSVQAIKFAVSELVSELVTRNQLDLDKIVSITFSVTSDLDACFPAAIARKREGWDHIALLDCQQMKVEGDLKYCIRILAIAWLPKGQKPMHPYLEKASLLRPDRSIES